MKIIVSSDHNITLTEESIAAIESTVQTTLGHFDTHLTRVDVTLSDGSAGRSTGDDIRCELKARPEGRTPEFATDNASTVDDALRGALHKMIHVLDSSFGRLGHHKGGSSMGGVEPR
jgi:hypothetical protein